MNPLRSKFQSRDVWEVPVLQLTPLWSYEGEVQHRGCREVFDSIREDGLHWPIVAVAMTVDQWARRIIRRKQPHKITPEVLWDNIILAVLIGNQRIEFARAFNYTHISTVLCPTEVVAHDWWKENVVE